MNNKELEDITYYGKEERNIEYKSSFNWRSENKLKVKVVQTILGMSNIRDGGYIIIGVKEKDNIFDPNGMKDEDFKSFKFDDVLDYSNKYAEPYIELDFNPFNDKKNNKKFIVIKVKEFYELPVICKKDYPKILERGAIYTRTKGGKHETCKVKSQNEMREILKLSLEKSKEEFKITFLKLLGISNAVLKEKTDIDKFNNQLAGI